MSLVVDALKKLKDENKNTSDIQAPLETKFENNNNGGRQFFAAGLIAGVVIAVGTVFGVLKLTDSDEIVVQKATSVAVQPQTVQTPAPAPLPTPEPLPAKTETIIAKIDEKPAETKKPNNYNNLFKTTESIKPAETKKVAQSNTVKKTTKATDIKKKTNTKNIVAKATTPKTVVAKKQEPIKEPSVKQFVQEPLPAGLPFRVVTNADYVSILSQGQSAWDNKAYDSALKFYTQAYEMRKEENVAGNIAALYLAINDPEKTLKTVKDTSTVDVSVISRLITEMVKKGYLYEAGELIKYSRKIKDSGELAYAEGYYYDYTKNYPKALAAFNRAFGLNHTEPLYAYSYARALDASGKYTEAIDAYRMTLALNPDGKTAEYVLDRIGTIQLYLGK